MCYISNRRDSLTLTAVSDDLVDTYTAWGFRRDRAPAGSPTSYAYSMTLKIDDKFAQAKFAGLRGDVKDVKILKKGKDKRMTNRKAASTIRYIEQTMGVGKGKKKPKSTNEADGEISTRRNTSNGLSRHTKHSGVGQGIHTKQFPKHSNGVGQGIYTKRFPKRSGLGRHTKQFPKHSNGVGQGIRTKRKSNYNNKGYK